MISSRKPTAGFWITVALVAVLVGYPLSFGPACWWLSSPTPVTFNPHRAMIVYWPLGAAARWNGPIGSALQWWMRFGTPDGHVALVPTNPNGTHAVGFHDYGSTQSTGRPR